MKTEICVIKGSTIPFDKEDTAHIVHAGEIIKNGGLVAFPTETVYGLGGDALRESSSEKIYAAKGRPSDNPLIVHIAKWEDIYKITNELPEEAKLLADQFWPGPLTMVLPKSELVPLKTTGGLNTVAVRMPSDEIARAFIEAAGGYVAAPSANLSGKPSPTKAKYVIQDMDGRIDMILDGGENEIGLESTIVDLTEETIKVLRPGFITVKDLSEALNREVEIDQAILDPHSNLIPKAPGMKYRHYAPKGELTIVEGESEMVKDYINRALEEDRRAGVMSGVITVCQHAGDYDSSIIKVAGDLEKPETIGKHLYTILREFDDENVERMYSESFSEGDFGQAIMNRLLKAAGYTVIKV